jgi:hypothetical protein
MSPHDSRATIEQRYSKTFEIYSFGSSKDDLTGHVHRTDSFRIILITHNRKARDMGLQTTEKKMAEKKNVISELEP